MEKVEFKPEASPAEAPVEAPQETPERPEWLPEKFKSPEDLAHAYAELEKHLGAHKETPQEPPKEPPASPVPESSEVKEELSQRGLDYDALNKEFLETGELSQDTYKSLEDAGIPKSMVDSYIEGQKAVADAFVTEVYSLVGGQQTYSDMIQWAAQNLPPAEVEAFDRTVTSGDPAMVKLVTQALHQRYTASEGRSPGKQVFGGSPSGGQGYRSRSEMTSAMKDPRYKSDPAYRQDVINKVAVSSF